MTGMDFFWKLSTGTGPVKIKGQIVVSRSVRVQIFLEALSTGTEFQLWYVRKFVFFLDKYIILWKTQQFKIQRFFPRDIFLSALGNFRKTAGDFKKMPLTF